MNKATTVAEEREKITVTMLKAEKTKKPSFKIEIEALAEILLLAEKEAFVTGGTFSNGTARIAHEALQNSEQGKKLLSSNTELPSGTILHDNSTGCGIRVVQSNCQSLPL